MMITDRVLADFLTAGLTRMLQGYGCTQQELYGVHFEHPRPPCGRAYTAVFGGVERFSAEFTGVEFAAEALDRPHLHANPELRSLVHAQAERCLARVTRPQSLVERLRLYLLNDAGAGVPEMPVAARDLGVSTRSMRRRLSEAGVTYRILTQDAQRERACTMLRNPEFTLQEVACSLGFLNTGSFHRAFKRWTGRTASEYRSGARSE